MEACPNLQRTAIRMYLNQRMGLEERSQQAEVNASKKMTVFRVLYAFGIKRGM